MIYSVDYSRPLPNSPTLNLTQKFFPAKYFFQANFRVNGLTLKLQEAIIITKLIVKFTNKILWLIFVGKSRRGWPHLPDLSLTNRD